MFRIRIARCMQQCFVPAWCTLPVVMVVACAGEGYGGGPREREERHDEAPPFAPPTAQQPQLPAQPQGHEAKSTKRDCHGKTQ